MASTILTFHRWVLIFVSLLGWLSSSESSATTREQNCIDTKTKIEEKFGCIEGLSFQEVTSEPYGPWRQFELQYQQPIDHQNPHLGHFQQRLALFHRSDSEPLVLHTNGYNIVSVAKSVITKLFATNQLQIEHRFYGDSRPPGRDWTKLNIKQASEDIHRVTVAFRQIYSKQWISTGRSKGGMTALFHRRFFPDDVRGTLADVAPISFNPADQRYLRYLDQVGGVDYGYCRARLALWQRRLLESRDILVPLINGYFSLLGSADLAFEHAVIEAPFVFWQYHSPDDPVRGCTAIPTESDPKQSFDFLQIINPLSQYEDESVGNLIPYYYQAATELGAPAQPTAHLEQLRRFDYTLSQYLPKELRPNFSNEAMIHVARWASSVSHSLILIYGTFDPWSAGQIELNSNGIDRYKFSIEKKNHNAQFLHLPPPERQKVVDLLTRWLEKPPVPNSLRLLRNDHTTLEILEQLQRPHL